MIKKLAVFLFIFHCSAACAQTIKTDVLVIGGNPGGVAAAVQSARSKLKTILIEQSPQLLPAMVGNKMIALSGDRAISSGIWGEFRRRVVQHYRKTPGYDTAYNAALQFEPDTGAAILTRIADSVKNLDIQLSTKFITIQKDNDRWAVTVVQNGKTETLKPRVVVDATEDGAVIAKAGATVTAFDGRANTAGLNLYRTAIAMGDGLPGENKYQAVPTGNYPPFPSWYIPVKALVASGADNLLVTGKLLPETDIQYLPAQLSLGQGAGVTAAYCAFFKTTTANLNVRVIQGELLDFKGCMLPFEDLGADPYWRAIQQVCATGLLKGVQKKINNKPAFVFVPDSTVSTAEVKPYLLEIYTRAFLWFNKEKPGDDFTIGNLLSFMSEITLTDPENMQQSIGKAWKTQYKFTDEFNLDNPVTRREFAILANKFLNPFARRVDVNGRVVN